MLDWLGQEGSRTLELPNWSLEDKQNKKKIIDALKAKCQPQENAQLYKQQATGPIQLGLKTLRCIGIFVKHLMVYIETIDIDSMIQHRLASQQIKRREEEENKTEYQVASEVLTVGGIPTTCRGIPGINWHD